MDWHARTGDRVLLFWNFTLLLAAFQCGLRPSGAIGIAGRILALKPIFNHQLAALNRGHRVRRLLRCLALADHGGAFGSLLGARRLVFDVRHGGVAEEFLGVHQHAAFGALVRSGKLAITGPVTCLFGSRPSVGALTLHGDSFLCQSPHIVPVNR